MIDLKETINFVGTSGTRRGNLPDDKGIRCGSEVRLLARPVDTLWAGHSVYVRSEEDKVDYHVDDLRVCESMFPRLSYWVVMGPLTLRKIPSFQLDVEGMISGGVCFLRRCREVVGTKAKYDGSAGQLPYLASYARPFCGVRSFRLNFGNPSPNCLYICIPLRHLLISIPKPRLVL